MKGVEPQYASRGSWMGGTLHGGASLYYRVHSGPNSSKWDSFRKYLTSTEIRGVGGRGAGKRKNTGARIWVVEKAERSS